jgi:hypothetical protein
MISAEFSWPWKFSFRFGLWHWWLPTFRKKKTTSIFYSSALNMTSEGPFSPHTIDYKKSWPRKQYYMMYIYIGMHCSVYSRCYETAARLANIQQLFLSKSSGKHVPAETYTHVTIDLLLETGCFLCGPWRDIMSRTVWKIVANVQLRGLYGRFWKTKSCNSVAVERGPERVKNQQC